MKKIISYNYGLTASNAHSSIQNRRPKMSETAPKTNDPTNIPAIKPACTLAAMYARSQIRLYWGKRENSFPPLALVSAPVYEVSVHFIDESNFDAYRSYNRS